MKLFCSLRAFAVSFAPHRVFQFYCYWTDGKHVLKTDVMSSPLSSSVVRMEFGREVFSRWLGAFERFAFGSR